MATKNKRRKPTKQHAGRKQKETAYDRLSRETDELMWEVATVADKLLDLLPAFRRLSEKNRRLIYHHMDVVVHGLELALDDYYETLPESEDDFERETDGLIDALAAGLTFGLVAKSLSEVRKSGDKDETKVDWPDAIDIKGKRIEREPGLLNPPTSKGD